MPVELDTTIITVIVAFLVGLLTAAASYIIRSRQLKQNDEKTHRELELELNRFREEISNTVKWKKVAHVGKAEKSAKLRAPCQDRHLVHPAGVEANVRDIMPQI